MDDLTSKDSQTPSFREQILRDLEAAKEKRATNQEPIENEVNSSDLLEKIHSFETSAKETIRDSAEVEATQIDLAEQPASFQPISELEDTFSPSKEELSDVPERKTRKKSSRKPNKNHKKKQEKAARRIVTVVIVIVLLTLGITAFSGYSYIKSSLDPIDASSKTNIQVEIPEGSTTMEIGHILVEKNLIKNATIFNYYSKIKSYNNYQSGYYNLNQSMSLDELAKALQESGTTAPQEPIAGKVRIIEGATLAEIAKSVTDNVYTDDKNDKTPFTSEEFLATVKNADFINRMVAAYPTLFASLPAADSGVLYQLEGYLFPATYEYSDSTTTEQLVEKMIAATDANLKNYYAQLSSKGLTVNQLLTLASLVEKEGATDEDRRNIASVFYNRLNANMPLQSNIAILYAMGKLGTKTTLAEDATVDTAIDSPYNVYTKTGLMPGPVDSPSLSAIEATVNPNTTNYYYFVADVTTGTVYYSTTLEEHNQNVEKYVNSKLNQ